MPDSYQLLYNSNTLILRAREATSSLRLTSSVASLRLTMLEASKPDCLQQVANCWCKQDVGVGVPTAKGRIAAATYRINGLRLVFPILYSGPGDARPRNCTCSWGIQAHLTTWFIGFPRVHTPKQTSGFLTKL